MVQGRYRAGLVAAGLLAWCGTAAAQKPQVTPAYILQYRPKQDAVVVTTPTDAEIANCKVEVVPGPNKTSAYVLRDARGQILRRFADTKGNNKVDTFCFYLDGQEVYRETETKGKAELLQTGELIQAGKAWRIIAAPTPGSMEPETVSPGGNSSEPFVNEETRGLVKKLEELDATAPKATDPAAAVHKYN